MNQTHTHTLLDPKYSESEVDYVLHEFLMGREYHVNTTRIYPTWDSTLDVKKEGLISSVRQSVQNMYVNYITMLADVGLGGALSPIAYHMKDHSIEGVVRDYSVPFINKLSLLVRNGDMLEITPVSLRYLDYPPTHKTRMAFTFGGREVFHRERVLISAPLMTGVYMSINKERK